MILVQRCDIIHRAPADTPDALGEFPFIETGRDLDRPCELQQSSSSEETVDRSTQIADWRLFLGAEETLGQWDQVLARGLTYEVVGVPEAIVHPWARKVDHVEARLRVVSG